MVRERHADALAAKSATPFRLKVRDTLLALSGQLDLTMGGPAVVQFVARGDATFMPGGNRLFWTTSTSIPTRPPRRAAPFTASFSAPSPTL